MAAGAWGRWSWHMHSRESEKMDLMLCAALLAVSVLYGPVPAQRMALPTIPMCLPISFNIVKLAAHTHAQRTISRVSGELTIVTTWLLYLEPPPVLCWYAPASHPPLLPLLASSLEPDHTALSHLFDLASTHFFFLFLERKPEHSLVKNIFSFQNELWPSRSPLIGS